MILSLLPIGSVKKFNFSCIFSRNKESRCLYHCLKTKHFFWNLNRKIWPVGRLLATQCLEIIWPGGDIIKIVSRISQVIDRIMNKCESSIEGCEVHIFPTIFPVKDLYESSMGQIKLPEESWHLRLHCM